jgi:hypothetical protein
MKAHDVIPGIFGGVAVFWLMKVGTADPAAMSFAGFSLAFFLCCYAAKKISVRAVISGLLAAPAGLFAIGVLHMELDAVPVMGSLMVLFVVASAFVGRKCRKGT